MFDCEPTKTPSERLEFYVTKKTAVVAQTKLKKDERDRAQGLEGWTTIREASQRTPGRNTRPTLLSSNKIIKPDVSLSSNEHKTHQFISRTDYLMTRGDTTSQQLHTCRRRRPGRSRKIGRRTWRRFIAIKD